MLELLTGGSHSQAFKQVPLLGYNFDKDISTSGSTITAKSGGVIEAIGSGAELAGYTKTNRNLNTVTTITPAAAAAAIGTGDFTLEFYVWLSAVPNNYTTVFSVKFANGKYILVQFGDAGFGNRMQFCVNPVNNNAEAYSVPLTRANALNAWRHIAFVRKDKRCKVFINGVQTNMASGTSSNYNLADYAASYDLSGAVTSVTMGGSPSSPWDIYIPEFAIFSGAKYNANFTRPIGPIVSL